MLSGKAGFLVPSPPARAWAARWAQRIQWLCLAGLLFTLPLWRHRILVHRPPEPVFYELHDFLIYASDLFWWGALGAWALGLWLRPPPTPWRMGPSLLIGPMLGLWALGALGAAFAVDPAYAWYQVARVGLVLGLYLMLLNSPWRPGLIIWPLAAGATVQAIIALLQFLQGHSLGLRRLGEVPFSVETPGTSVVFLQGRIWPRAYGLTQHPNMLGGFLMFFLLLAIGYYLSQTGWRRLALMGMIGLGLTALMLTFSRAAWLGTLVGSAILLTLATRSVNAQRLRRESLLPLALVLLGIVAVFTAANWPTVSTRLGFTAQALEARSVQERWTLITAAWTLLRQRPILGVGLGNFSVALYRLAPEAIRPFGVYQPVHNVPLLVAAELGLLGGGLWLLLSLAPWLLLWLSRRSTPLTPWMAGVSGALAGLMVVSWLDFYVWFSQQGRLMQWLAWALWAREWEGRRPI